MEAKPTHLHKEELWPTAQQPQAIYLNSKMLDLCHCC
jgi:hypothetical protein